MTALAKKTGSAGLFCCHRRVACPGSRRLTLPCRCPAGWLALFAVRLPCRCGVRRGACPLCRLPTLPLVCFLSPIPPTPFPAGRGRPKVYFAGGFAPGTPALNRLRHLQSLPYRCSAGGLFCLPSAYSAFTFFMPPSPQPPSQREGGIITLFRRGRSPRHPCTEPLAALTEPAVQVLSGGLAPRHCRYPAGALRLGRGTGEQCRQPRRGGTGGEELSVARDGGV